MKLLALSCIAGGLLCGLFVRGLCAQAPRNVSVTFNGETDAAEPLGAKGDIPATVHKLPGLFRALRAHGALGEAVTEMKLRSAEAAILVRPV